MLEIARSCRRGLSYAVRSLASAPTYTLVAVATLALGIGATSGLFTVVHGVLLRPLPYPDAQELVRIHRGGGERGATEDVGWLDFQDWRQQAQGFRGMAAYAEDAETFEWEGRAEELTGFRVTGDFFSVLGVDLLIGRTFDASEDVQGGSPAIVLSHVLWQSRFGGDPGVLGRSVQVNGSSVPVVGVAPEGFAFPAADVMFWQPLQGEQLLTEVHLPTGLRALGFLDVVGRVEPEARERAATDLVRLATRIDEANGRSRDAGDVRVVPLAEAIVGEARSTLLFLFAAVVLVLLVACANVAGLALGRLAGRQREIAVRTALGAGRPRLIAQLLGESLVLAAGAGIVGGTLGWGLAGVVHRLSPPGLPRLSEIRPDASMLVFASCATIVSGLLFALLPALRASRVDLAAALAGLGRGNSGEQGTLRAQRMLVVSQVAVSVTLLSTAALLVSSYTRLMRVERGFESDGVILASLQPSTQRYADAAAVDRYYSRLLERVRATPGVRSATTTYSPPLADNAFNTRIARTGEEDDEDARCWSGTVIIRDDYFATTGVPLLRGREFDSRDSLGSPPVAIVNQTLARLLWPGEDPLGKRFSFAGGVKGAADSFDRSFFRDEPYTVVGVAGDVRRTSLAAAPDAAYYRPHSQITWAFQYLLVRTQSDPRMVMERLREEVWAVDPTVPVRTLRTLGAQVADSVAEPRFRMSLLGGFALAACGLAMVGLYAVTALAVERRTRELGIRVALGAQSRAIVRSVLQGGLGLVAAGAGAGLLASVLLTRTLSSMLFEISPTDPSVYAAVVVATAVVALLACYVPALRASRVDPIVALRDG